MKMFKRNYIVILAVFLALSAAAFVVVSHYRNIPVETAAPTSQYENDITETQPVTESTAEPLTEAVTQTASDQTTDDNNIDVILPDSVLENSISYVTVNPANLKLLAGKTILLSYSVYPSGARAKTVAWKSSNTNVATVTGTGKVTAVSVGSAAITCTVTDLNQNKKETVIPVTVSKPNYPSYLTPLQLNNAELLSFVFNSDGDYFYTEEDPWQRQFGFEPMYDWGASLVGMYYSTVRVKFNYDGLDWMVQFWKGQYGFAFIGSEIGVYTKLESIQSDHYDCASDENALKMSMKLYKKDALLFERPYAKYWWMTGFVPGNLERYADRTELTMEARITLKDNAMANAFIEAFKVCGFTSSGTVNKDTLDAYRVSGNTVYFNWKNIEQ